MHRNPTKSDEVTGLSHAQVSPQDNGRFFHQSGEIDVVVEGGSGKFSRQGVARDDDLGFVSQDYRGGHGPVPNLSDAESYTPMSINQRSLSKRERRLWKKLRVRLLAAHRVGFIDIRFRLHTRHGFQEEVVAGNRARRRISPCRRRLPQERLPPVRRRGVEVGGRKQQAGQVRLRLLEVDGVPFSRQGTCEEVCHGGSIAVRGDVRNALATSEGLPGGKGHNCGAYMGG